MYMFCTLYYVLYTVLCFVHCIMYVFSFCEDDDQVDIDTYMEGDSQTLRESLQWEAASNTSSPTDSTSTNNSKSLILTMKFYSNMSSVTCLSFKLYVCVLYVLCIDHRTYNILSSSFNGEYHIANTEEV